MPHMPWCRFQAGCLYFGGLIYEDPKDNNRLYCEPGCYLL